MKGLEFYFVLIVLNDYSNCDFDLELAHYPFIFVMQEFVYEVLNISVWASSQQQHAPLHKLQINTEISAWTEIHIVQH